VVRMCQKWYDYMQPGWCQPVARCCLPRSPGQPQHLKYKTGYDDDDDDFGCVAKTASKMTFGPVSATAVSGTCFRHGATSPQPYCFGRHWSSSGFVIWPLSRRPSTSGHTLNMLQLISLSCLRRPHRSRTVVICCSL